jgi:DNA-nicking Smr family endonuclease
MREGRLRAHRRVGQTAAAPVKKKPQKEPSFADLVGPLRRIETDMVPPERPRSPARPRRAPTIPRNPSVSLLADDDPCGRAAEHEERADYHRGGVQASVVRRLKRGQYRIEAELDLHGLIVREAGHALAHFLDSVRTRRVICVRIIHGKGIRSPGREPVLKPQVARWLRAHDAVLAFAPAQPKDGGDGALYVLVRSQSGTSAAR